MTDTDLPLESGHPKLSRTAVLRVFTRNGEDRQNGFSHFTNPQVSGIGIGKEVCVSFFLVSAQETVPRVLITGVALMLLGMVLVAVLRGRSERRRK